MARGARKVHGHLDQPALLARELDACPGTLAMSVSSTSATVFNRNRPASARRLEEHAFLRCEPLHVLFDDAGEVLRDGHRFQSRARG